MLFFLMNSNDIIQALHISVVGFLSLLFIVLLITIPVYCVHFISKQIEHKK